MKKIRDIDTLQISLEEQIEKLEEVYYDILESLPLATIEKREDLCNKIHDYYLMINTYKEVLELIDNKESEVN